MTINDKILDDICALLNTHNPHRNGRLTWSVEYGRGETYATKDVTLYAHDEYERSSVLYGRSRRSWVATFGEGPQAEQDARDTIAAAKLGKRCDWMLGTGGSTHIPIDQIVSHIPDDTDY